MLGLSISNNNAALVNNEKGMRLGTFQPIIPLSAINTPHVNFHTNPICNHDGGIPVLSVNSLDKTRYDNAPITHVYDSLSPSAQGTPKKLRYEALSTVVCPLIIPSSQLLSILHTTTAAQSILMDTSETCPSENAFISSGKSRLLEADIPVNPFESEKVYDTTISTVSPFIATTIEERLPTEADNSHVILPCPELRSLSSTMSQSDAKAKPDFTKSNPIIPVKPFILNYPSESIRAHSRLLANTDVFMEKYRTAVNIPREKISEEVPVQEKIFRYCDTVVDLRPVKSLTIVAFEKFIMLPNKPITEVYKEHLKSFKHMQQLNPTAGQNEIPVTEYAEMLTGVYYKYDVHSGTFRWVFTSFILQVYYFLYV